MDASEIKRWASILDDACAGAWSVPQLSASTPSLGVDDGYAIQSQLIANRLSRGERRIGMKVGLTSRAKMAQVGVSEVIWGRLTDAMLIEEGGTISRRRYVHPRIEPEVAFILRSPLSGAVTQVEALRAVEAVAPAMELIDSRYEDFKFSLADVVADNASSSGLVLGAPRKPEADLSNLGVILEVNGRIVEIGSTAAVLGHPLRSLVAAARLAGAAGETLNEGDIVMSGGVTAAWSLGVGDRVRALVQELGSVSLSVAD